MILRRIQHYIHQHQLLSKGDHVLVALSGGADSVTLLDVLLLLDYRCTAVHCNFHLRAEESDRDEQFVVALCHTRQVPLHIKHFSTDEYARTHHISIEMAARELRYEWFEELRCSLQCQAIAVAHHQNDQAETLLMNLQRGTGIRGLEGMKPRNGKVIRPLLCISRYEIMRYVTSHSLSYVNDSTNTDITFHRNAIRKELERYSETKIRKMADLCQRMQGYTKLLNHTIAQLKKEIVVTISDETRIDIAQLLTTPAPEIVLYELLREFGFTHTDKIFQNLSEYSGKRFYSDTHVVVKDREYLLIISLIADECTMPIVNKSIRQASTPITYPSATCSMAFVDERLASASLYLRHWHEGDFFFPIGMGGKKKKVSDFFTDLKLSLFEKERVWLLCKDEDIVWIVGYRLDERYKVPIGATQFTELTITYPSSL